MATQVQAQDKTITVDGAKLHYLDWGTAGKPTMVLLHGFTSNAHTWDDFAVASCPDYHILALDQRGHGESDWAKDGNYATEAYVSDFDGFCDALNLRSFVLMGHSMGGRNSMAFTARYPDKVQKLILVDIGPATATASSGSSRISQGVIARPPDFDSMEAVMEYMKENASPYSTEEALRSRLQYSTKRLPNGKIGWCYDLETFRKQRQNPVPPPADQWPVIRSINCPTLIVRGADSDVLSPEVAHQMEETMPNPRLVEIQRAGHGVPTDNPVDFLAAVRSFLK